MRRFSLHSLILAAGLAFAAAGNAAGNAPGDEARADAPVPLDPALRIGKLANGLTYYIRRNSVPQRRLELRLVVKAGSAVEDDDQHGLAHFLEHMAFNGSTHFKRNELVSYLESIGLKFGADLNAVTTLDETVYMLPVPTAKQEHIDQAFTILEDWAHGLTLLDADIDKERNVIVEEVRQREGADRRVWRGLVAAQFKGMRYVEHGPGGKEELIRGFKPEVLRRFYRDWYRPDLMAIVAVGDVEPEELEQQIKAHFSSLANPAGERARVFEQPGSRTASEALAVTDREVARNQVQIHYPVRAASNPDTYGGLRTRMLEALQANMLGQRLAELAQQPDAPFTSAASGPFQLIPHYRGYTARAMLGAGGSGPALAALVREQQRARQLGFSAAELERARKDMLRSDERNYTQKNAMPSALYAADYQRHFLHGGAVPGVEHEHRFAPAMLNGITLDEVNAFARSSIPAPGAAALVAYIGSDAAQAPAADRLLADVAAAESAPVGAREEKALAKRLMETPPAPGSIVAESVDKNLRLTRLTFSNGVKAILKPGSGAVDQVVLSAQRFGGQSLYEARDLPSVRYAGALVNAMGVKDFTPIELRKVLAGRSASVDLRIQGATDEVSGSSGAGVDELETMLQLLWLRFDGVRRDENLYKTFMANQEEVLRHRGANPLERLNDAVTDALYANHPYEPHAPMPAYLATVELDRTIALYRRRFASAKGFTFVLAGNFDVERIKPLLATYLGSLPTPELPLAYRDVGMRFASGVVKQVVEAGSEARSMVTLNFTGPATWSLDETVRLDALVEVMNLRVIDVLRQKLGLIYSGGLRGALARAPWQHYQVTATLPTTPAHVEQVAAALLAEIERIKKAGPDPLELEKVKTNWRQSWPNKVGSNAWIAATLSSAELYGTDVGQILAQPRRAEALTVDDVKAAAQRYFNTENYVQVVLNPEAEGPARTVAKTQP